MDWLFWLAGALVVGFILWLKWLTEGGKNRAKVMAARQRQQAGRPTPVARPATPAQAVMKLGTPSDEQQAQIVCPHCQTRGCVKAMTYKHKGRLSATRIGLTVASLGGTTLATGVRKGNKATRLSCANCGMEWSTDQPWAGR